MNATQVNSFEEPIALNFPYKPGDWVKVQRKPKIGGAYLKRGDKVQITAVHPLDGSIKFWNDRCNEWDYLHPEDLKLLQRLKPKVKVVVEELPLTPVEVVVEELLLTPVEVVVEELLLTPVEVVVEELPTTNKSSTTKPSRASSGWLDRHYKIRDRESRKQRTVTRWEQGCTGPYYTYRWMDRKRQRGKYISASKAEEVTKAIECNATIAEILEIIK